jgi:hypothetical protein
VPKRAIGGSEPYLCLARQADFGQAQARFESAGRLDAKIEDERACGVLPPADSEFLGGGVRF